MTDAVFPWNVGGKERRLYEILSRLEAEHIDSQIFTMKWWSGSSRCLEGGLAHEAVLPLQPLYTPMGRRSIVEGILFGAASLKLLWKQYDLIDVDSMPLFPVISMKIVSVVRRKPLVATWHEVWGRTYWSSYLGKLGFIAAVLEHVAIRCPDVIISDSEHTSKKLRAIGASSVVTVPLGADVDRLLSGGESAGPAYDVVYMGRLLSHKNVSLLLRAINISRIRGRLVRALIVGSGPDLSSLMAECESVGLNDLATFRPFVSEDEYAGTMRSARVFVLPSLREGFGLVVLEANVCGLPVIVVDHPDNAAVDLVVPGVNGLVCANSAPALADAIGELLDNIEGFSVKEHAEAAAAKHDWSNIAAQYTSVMLGVLAGKATTS